MQRDPEVLIKKQQAAKKWRSAFGIHPRKQKMGLGGEAGMSTSHRVQGWRWRRMGQDPRPSHANRIPPLPLCPMGLSWEYLHLEIVSHLCDTPVLSRACYLFLQEELALMQQGQGMFRPVEPGHSARWFVGHLGHLKCETPPGCLFLAYKGGLACRMVTPGLITLLADWQERSSKASRSQPHFGGSKPCLGLCLHRPVHDRFL